MLAKRQLDTSAPAEPSQMRAADSRQLDESCGVRSVQCGVIYSRAASRPIGGGRLSAMPIINHRISSASRLDSAPLGPSCGQAGGKSGANKHPPATNIIALNLARTRNGAIELRSYVATELRSYEVSHAN